MLTLRQRVTVHCTDTGIETGGEIIHIRPDGFDVELGQEHGALVLHMKKHKPGIYVGNRAGMEFVVRTSLR